ncbi:hypothetical protein SAMN03159443_05206 [Pseudomonas sp. NFACC15-1]|nr:hypothetical protein SAMN03159443_05206 [Pseudomonas sp. NFACC15-1]SDZ13098.1 hypothetical protein SAMN03159380_05508 [Pseudomonas sp. NFACC14]
MILVGAENRVDRPIGGDFIRVRNLDFQIGPSFDRLIVTFSAGLLPENWLRMGSAKFAMVSLPVRRPCAYGDSLLDSKPENTGRAVARPLLRYASNTPSRLLAESTVLTNGLSAFLPIDDEMQLTQII